MKNMLCFAIGLIAAVFISSAQTINDYIQSVDLIDMEDFKFKYNSPYCYFDGAIYYTYFDEDDIVKDRHYLVKKTPKSSDTIEFSAYTSNKIKGFWKIVTDSKYVIFEDQFFTYYFLRTTNGLKNLFTSPHREFSQDIKILGNKIYLSHSNIQSNSLWEKTHTWVEVFDLEKKTHRIYDFPNPSGIEYMYFQPRKLIDFTEDNVYVMDVLEYKIKIFNYDGKLVDSIYKPFKDNQIVATQTNDFTKEEVYNYDLVTQRIQANREVFLKNLNNAKVMCSINILSDTTMMICYNEPKEGNKGYTYAFDLWKFDTKKKKWIVVKEGLKMEPYKNEEREGNFDLKRIPLQNKFSAYYNNILVTQNKYSYDILKLKTYTTWKEFHSLNEDYLKKSEIPNTIFIYKLWF